MSLAIGIAKHVALGVAYSVLVTSLFIIVLCWGGL